MFRAWANIWLGSRYPTRFLISVIINATINLLLLKYKLSCSLIRTRYYQLLMLCTRVLSISDGPFDRFPRHLYGLALEYCRQSVVRYSLPLRHWKVDKQFDRFNAIKSVRLLYDPFCRGLYCSLCVRYYDSNPNFSSVNLLLLFSLYRISPSSFLWKCRIKKIIFKIKR